MIKKYGSLLLSMLLFMGLQAAAQHYKTRWVVATDGSGDFTSVQAAIDACKSFPDTRITIYIKNGVYKEKVVVPSWNTRLTLMGESRDSTIITWGDYFGKMKRGPNSTFHTATLEVRANDFEAVNLTIENSAGPVGQALALSVVADRCSVRHCRLLGNQDTLYAAGENARQYYKDCYIEGTTDFIFGEATALFDSCTLMSKGNSYITAASTPQGVAYGFVFKNCTLKAGPGVDKVLLGRPWRKYARVVFIDCNMGAFIRPAGWANWGNPANEKTAFYAEYNSVGEGADISGRVKWSNQLTRREAAEYTVKNIFAGSPGWNPEAPAASQ